MIPSDDLASRQWHLFESLYDGRSNIGLGMPEIWDDYTGRGVTIGIWDDGIEYTHPDLAGNYDTRLHVTLNGEVHDPMARSSDSDHGTAVAGLIAADANDGGTVGVAHGARIAGVDFNSSVGTKAITFGALRDFDVINHSWSPDNGYIFDRNDRDWIERYRDGLEDAVDNGRDGLGTITVFSAGNRRALERHTNDSALTSAAETIAVAAVANDGVLSSYASPGSSLLVSAPSSGISGFTIWTTDRTGNQGYNTGSNQTWNPSIDHTATFGGTSTAAALTSGVVALMLEANPDLGWRDVQEILAYSARHVGGEVGGARRGAEAFDWAFNGAGTWNGGGLHHSNDYGFGLIDTFAAIRLAERWTETQTSRNRRVETDAEWSGNERVREGDADGIRIDFTVRAESDVETVAVDLDFDGGRIADYRIVLISPDGTRSILSTPGRDGDDVTDWFYSSKAFWGEDAPGDWSLRITDPTENGREGSLRGAELIFFGGKATNDDVFVFTEEFSDYAGAGFGHSGRITDSDGGTDTLNASAMRDRVKIDLRDGTGTIDGVDLTLSGRFERALGGDGDDRLFGSGASDILDGGRGADRLLGRGDNDRLDGGDGADRLEGGSGADVLKGGGGADRLKGGGGADKLFGNGGEDRLIDGAGADKLFGGKGADVFVLKLDGATDRIRDFEDGSDLIRLAGVTFGQIDIQNRPGDLVRLTYAGDKLLISGDGLDASDLGAADFLLG